MAEPRTPTLEVLELHEERWMKKLQQLLEKSITKKPLESWRTEEVLGLYYAAKAFFTVTICLAYLRQPDSPEDADELKAAISNSIENHVHKWLRTMPATERTFLLDGEEKC